MLEWITAAKAANGLAGDAEARLERLADGGRLLLGREQSLEGAQMQTHWIGRTRQV